MLPSLKRRSNRPQGNDNNNWSIFAKTTLLASSWLLSVSSQSSHSFHAVSASRASSSRSSTPQPENTYSKALTWFSQLTPSQYQVHLPLTQNQQPFLPISSTLIPSSSRTTRPQAPITSGKTSVAHLHLHHHQVLRPALDNLDYKDGNYHLETRQSRLKSRHLTRRQQQVQPDPSLTPSFPQPFDTSLSTDFQSDTCQPFMSAFLHNAAFQKCHPFSLLLATSAAFFRAVESMSSSDHSNNNDTQAPMSLNQVLDASCQADTDECEALFNRLAVDIKSRQIGCGKDLDKNNSLPLQALNGFHNYRLMRNIGCLTANETITASKKVHQDPDKANNTIGTSPDKDNVDYNLTNNSTLNATQPPIKYCFEKAASSQTPDDLYYYYLPLGTNLPSGTRASCDQCTKSIMKLYSIAASNRSLDIHTTYSLARMMTNLKCGPGYAPAIFNPASRAVSEAGRCFSVTSRVSLIVGITLASIGSLFL